MFYGIHRAAMDEASDPADDPTLSAREAVACRVLAQLLASEGRAVLDLSPHELDAAIDDLVALIGRLAPAAVRRLM